MRPSEPKDPFAQQLLQARGTAGGPPTQRERGLGEFKPFPDETVLQRGVREGRYAVDFDPTYGTPPPARPAPQQPAPPPRAQRGARAQPVLGSGRVSIDLNHTRFTAREGPARNRNVSIRRHFDPLTENGIALTTAQARQLGIRVGDVVTIRDTANDRTFRATYYDNAGVRPGADNLGHFEVDPALADALGISYRNRRGQVVDAVMNSRQVDGRFRIER